MQNHKVAKIILIVWLVSIPVLGVVGLLARKPSDSSTPVSSTSTSTSSTSTSTSASASASTAYSLSQIAAHNSASSCWMAIDGGVYDVTNFISQHPGGRAEILKGCGIDATELFNTKDGRGDSHSASAKDTLQSYKIGTLSR